MSGLPGGSEVKASAHNVGDLGSTPGSGRSPGEEKWQPTPVFLPGKSHGQRSRWAAVHGVAKSQTWQSDFTFSNVSQLKPPIVKKKNKYFEILLKKWQALHKAGLVLSVTADSTIPWLHLS